MKNRFSRMGKSLLGAVCLLSMSGITYSCTDDYDLDETMPNFLGKSIYDELKARNFNNVVKLIDDLKYDEVLSKTGSKTLFVASDEAFDNFFRTTDWIGKDGSPVRSYENLTDGQKRWLLNGSMLNSAYVVEMLAHQGKIKNQCLRQGSALSVIDTVRYWKWDELPENKHVAIDANDAASGDKFFWDYYRDNHKNIYMALDKTSPMLTHFLEGHMKEKNIEKSDIAFILNDANGWPKDEDRKYIYGSRIQQEDVTCLNGYFNVLDSLLVTPQNMAEVIRTNGETTYFSAMLERFSAPYYDADLTTTYRDLYGLDRRDSVFHKRYISERSIGNAKIVLGPDKKNLGKFPVLPFDPGWNELTAGTTVDKEKDMAAMFVPTDKAMVDYFVNGAGQGLIERYAKGTPNTEANLMDNLYKIPLDLIATLIRNLMKDSFLETVPSKYLTIMNDAQDQMFPINKELGTNLNVESYKKNFEKCLLANNGVIYMLKNVVAPADFSSVIAPVLYKENTEVVKAMLRADEDYVQGDSYDRAPLKKYYSTYLKAMKSHFSLFVPTDEGLANYGLVDPTSLAIGNSPEAMKSWRYYCFEYDTEDVKANSPQLPIRANAYKYNPETGPQEGDMKLSNFESKPKDFVDAKGSYGYLKKFLLVDMIDQHIIVHDNNTDAEGMNSGREYFTSREGAPVRLVKKGTGNNGEGMIVNGGYQVQLNSNDLYANQNCEVVEAFDLTPKTENGNYGNGMTYLLDKPMQPTTRSVYNILNSDEDFSDFLELASINIDPDVLEMVGFKDSTVNSKNPAEEWKSIQSMLRIFDKEDGKVHPAKDDRLVRFFNNFRYTLYVPTNAAMQEAYHNGLPSVQTIIDFIDSHKYSEDDGEGGTIDKMHDEDKIKAQAMITLVVNFVKYHFQDQSLFVDHISSKSINPTSCIYNEDPNSNNKEDGVYMPIGVVQTNGSMYVIDNDHLPVGVTEQSLSENMEGAIEIAGKHNLLARDANFDKAADANPRSIANSSHIVIHQVPKVLNFIKGFSSEHNGDYNSVLSTPSKAKAFLAKYRILK